MAKINGISKEKNEKERSINLEVPRIFSMVREPRKMLVSSKKTLSLLERDIARH